MAEKNKGILKDIKFEKSLYLPIILALIGLLLLLPEVLKERIFPYDGALYAANGAFFLTVFKELSSVILSPINWIWDYYNQYPALFIRRQPPIFGIIECGIFGLLGISAVSAKITVLLFSIFWIFGWFATLQKMFKDQFISFFALLLMVTFPMTVGLGSSVLIDIPSMMFFAWGCYFLALFLEDGKRGRKYSVLMSVFFALSLYTYQLPLFGVVAAYLYIVLSDWGVTLRRKDFYLSLAVFVILMLPLAIFTLKFASDNVVGIIGNTPKKFEMFVPVESKLDIEWWLYYLKMIAKKYPLILIGVLVWGATAIKIKPQKYEFLFVLWFIIGYLGFSLIPSKGPRYAYHFIIAALPLCVIGIRKLINFTIKDPDHLKIRFWIGSFCVLIFVGLNIWNIGDMRAPYVEGVDKAAALILSQDKSPVIFYNGAFESAFIFYIRKLDSNRKARVLRSGNEIANPTDLEEKLKKNGVQFVVFENENLRKGVYGGIYDKFWQKLWDLAKREKEFEHFGDVRVRYGKPNEEKDVYLKILKVIGS